MAQELAPVCTSMEGPQFFLPTRGRPIVLPRDGMARAAVMYDTRCWWVTACPVIAGYPVDMVLSKLQAVADGSHMQHLLSSVELCKCIAHSGVVDALLLTFLCVCGWRTPRHGNLLPVVHLTATISQAATTPQHTTCAIDNPI